MNTVTFTLQKIDGTLLDLEYVPFNNIHSELWFNSIQTGSSIQWGDRVYNLTDYKTEIAKAIEDCNYTITQINNQYNLNIPSITTSNLQQDINFIHTFFVDSNLETLWHDLNCQLHGIEILERSKHKKFQGQVFLELENKQYYDIPNSSFKYFSTRKVFGYCYANYSHIGRHIFEMYNAKDEEAHDGHIIPMHKISGSSYLWFGDTTNWIYDKIRMFKIKRWFIKNKINDIVDMSWGDPRLAIGWLTVAKLKTKINKQDLIGCEKVLKISTN
jgi:hypothetical protein